MQFNNVALIGIGQQALRSHIPMILRNKNTIEDVTTLINTIIDYPEIIHQQGGRIDKLCGDAVHRVSLPSNKNFELDDARYVLSQAVSQGANKFIVSTEPVAHKHYLNVLLEQKYPFLIDKPIICYPDASIEPNQLYLGLNSLQEIEKISRTNTNCFVNISRRLVDCFQRVRDEICQCYNQTKQIVTSVSVNYFDGEARSLSGIIKQKNHPFHLGYGTLYHSTYHVIDTGLWLLGLTHPDLISKMEVISTARTAKDYLYSREDLSEELKIIDLDMHHCLEEDTQCTEFMNNKALFTEYDVSITIKILRSDGHTVLLTVNSFHDSASFRKWSFPKNDQERYHNARLSDETYHIIQGEMQNIFLRRHEIPTLDNDCGPRINKVFYSDVTRNMFMCDMIRKKPFEILVNNEFMDTIDNSGKNRAMRAFLEYSLEENNLDGDGGCLSEMSLIQHINTQRIILLASGSLANNGKIMVWRSSSSSK